MARPKMRAICGVEELAKGTNWGPKHAPIHWICRVSHGSLDVARDPFSESSHGSRGQKRTMEERPAIDLLSTLGMDELRKLWRDGGDSRPPPRLKPILLREARLADPERGPRLRAAPKLPRRWFQIRTSNTAKAERASPP